MKQFIILLAIVLGLSFALPLTNPVLSIAQEEGSEGSEGSEAPSPERPDDGGGDSGGD